MTRRPQLGCSARIHFDQRVHPPASGWSSLETWSTGMRKEISSSLSRPDRMIKTLGYRVSPDEVVDVLYASGEIVEAVVATEPDELRGSRIMAYVVLDGDGRLDRLEAFCAKEMPRYMQPSRIEVRKALSRTASGKHDVRATIGEQS